MKKILLSFVMVLLFSNICHSAKNIDYPLNTSPLMTDNAMGIDDPASEDWATNRFSFGDIFSLYLTQNWSPTGSVDLSGASGAVTIGRQSNQIFYDGTFTMTTVVFAWTGNHTHEYGDYDSQTVAASEVDASGIVSGVKSITAGAGLTNSGTATNPILDMANTIVTPGSYTSANITVDQQGRITAASDGTADPINTETVTGATLVIDIGNKNYSDHTVTIDQNTAITFSNFGTSATRFKAWIKTIQSDGDFTVTIGGVSVDLTASGNDTVIAYTDDGGTTVNAVIAQADIN